MAVTAATVTAKMDLAITAMGDADWGSALSYLLQAKAALSALPDADHGSARLKWDRAGIDALIREVKQQRGTGTGVQTQKYKYVEATD